MGGLLEGDLSNKEFVTKHEVPKGSFSTWAKKKKDKHFAALQQSSNERKKS